jgi:hypothetical protein
VAGIKIFAHGLLGGEHSANNDSNLPISGEHSPTRLALAWTCPWRPSSPGGYRSIV